MKPDYTRLTEERLRDALIRETESRSRQSSFASPEAFEAWLMQGHLRAEKKQRRKIRITLTAAAAVILCAVFLAGSDGLLSAAFPENLGSLLSPGETIAAPNPHDGSDAEEQNGSIVIGGDHNGNMDTWTASFTSYDDIPDKYKEEIIWFEDMPEGYELEEIEIVRNQDNIEIYITGKISNKNIQTVQVINDKGEMLTVIMNQFEINEKIATRNVYIKKSTISTSYVFEITNGVLEIRDECNIPQKEIEAMIASIKTGWSM